MIKIIELTYSQQLLEEYLNKKYTLLWFIWDKMIFKYIEKTPTQRQVKSKWETERFFELSEAEFTDYTERLSIAMMLDSTALRIELEKFKKYRLEKWDNDKKYRYQKQDTFEIKARINRRINDKKYKIHPRIETKEQSNKPKSYYCEYWWSHTESTPYWTCDCAKYVWWVSSARFIMNMKEIWIIMIWWRVNGEKPLTKEQIQLYKDKFINN